MEVLELPNFGLLSIIPPLVAIVLALVNKEVISSLIVGILAGALIYSKGNIIEMITITCQVMGEKIGGNAYILIFLGLLGAIVIVVTKAGGSAAYGDWAVKRITTRRGASLATIVLGCLIFIDDYFNCLTVGTVMRPVTDKHRISRAKLAYLLDATAAPVCIIAPISSWGASVATYMQQSGCKNGMIAFITTIPYNLYAILTIVMIIIVCVTKLNFGPMKKFEKNAIENGDVFSNKEQAEEEYSSSNNGTKGKVYDLVIPIVTLIIATILAMIYTGGGFTGKCSISDSFGNCDAPLSLVLGSFIALIITFILFIPRKIISFTDFMEGITEGIKSMVPAFTILILAWTISGICSKDYLNTGGFLGNLVNEFSFPVFILPAFIFIVAGFLGFATGTSWGTMAILIPIGAAITSTSNTADLLYPVLGAILAGAVYGDHISPISDTTILSSTGAGCNHIDHVSTQIVYATVVAGCCLVGFLLSGLLFNPYVSLLISIILMILVLYIIHKFKGSNKDIDYSKVNY
ncbi:Na+/H+ antiporter NhaC family protein [Anaerosacchariphilus polymeriproducens]|uniref:Na+/H+ antiporter NhaC family protein n=1 Tax=Anaerosacchariphilus polymeriproducens TaxID=1812858 RepID=A0A371AZ68_9FIRM|nr:Na+/H+ antiporter NhaC family protein [Anaerosacchariphilus polymeriproducens]RDU24843.1 Na+/H+ antiporter NhaC family protein [Anaerosacchariphilus polymeriproducens]